MGESMKLNSKTELHPWKVISSFLLDINDSDCIPRIVNRTGLNVDWALTEQESYSHKTRKRAYFPKIEFAFKKLPEEKQLLVSSIMAKELASESRKYKQELNSALNKIGWKLEADGITIEDINIREMFFPKGTSHDAYVEIRKILNMATSRLIIIDPWLDSSIFQLLKTLTVKSMKVCLLTYNLSSDFALEANKFLAQYPHFLLKIKKTKAFHDRFIILDSIQCYHVGASIKDAGLRAFMISQLEDENNTKTLIEQQKQSWKSATTFKI